MGKDSDALKQSYMYLKRAINEDRYYSPNPKEVWLLALGNLTITNWLNYKMQTVEEVLCLRGGIQTVTAVAADLPVDESEDL